MGFGKCLWWEIDQGSTEEVFGGGGGQGINWKAVGDRVRELG